ncbi:hypothetical protein DOS79_01445 [Staphylococcus felis]|uniref:Uncharacterized protein n=1 Tax=Staphylococcus felis TaxID=46127 RepID=A0AAX1RWB8_9STAP|nr:hypothetical protein DOS60_02415 [Staphylococcus felis]REH84381.1 hypothetical protein DOS56_04315 [Staphylococcus felis]REH87889.1 hypothetical protein DOS63_00425 [Staphylococcus felis]REH93244.1 hypothetical protein DOS67_11685 [Staphylococcus felis]REH99475.1 hypothetical protein DOS64_08685 [Staphylococcus felis]
MPILLESFITNKALGGSYSFEQSINGVSHAEFSTERHSSTKLKHNFARYEVLLEVKAQSLATFINSV